MTNYEMMEIKKGIIKGYWERLLSEYKDYLRYPQDDGSWNSFSFSSLLLNNHDHSLVMVSLYRDKILVSIIDWRGEEEFKEERSIKDYASFINTINRINKSKKFFGAFLK